MSKISLSFFLISFTLLGTLIGFILYKEFTQEFKIEEDSLLEIVVGIITLFSLFLGIPGLIISLFAIRKGEDGKIKIVGLLGNGFMSGLFLLLVYYAATDIS